MIDLVCKLLSTTYTKNSIGVSVPTVNEVECPIIKTESIYAKEFYKAYEQGLKPTLRLRISALNYNDEPELVYMGVTYTIIRVEPIGDELILIGQRKVKNVKESSSRGYIESSY